MCATLGATRAVPIADGSGEDGSGITWPPASATHIPVVGLAPTGKGTPWGWHLSPGCHLRVTALKLCLLSILFLFFLLFLLFLLLLGGQRSGPPPHRRAWWWRSPRTTPR